MKLSFKNVFSKLAATSVLALALVAVNPAYAAAPTGASAVMNGSTSTTVNMVVTGTDFDAFVSSQTATANGTDLAKITYNSQVATGAVINNVTTMTVTFPIAAGTHKSGGSLVLAAGAVEDAGNTGNATITIVNGSITDSAAPQVISVTPANSATGVNRTSNIVIRFSEPMTTGSLSFSTSPSITYSPTWSTTTFANDTVTLAHSSQSFYGSTNHTATIAVGTTDAATAPNAIAQYQWSFTAASSGSSTYTTGGDSQTTTTTSTGSTTVDTTNAVITTTPTPVVDYSGCTATSAFSTTTGKSCAGFVAPAQVVIAGCEGRNTGFSTVSGQSCAGNSVSSSVSSSATVSGSATAPSATSSLMLSASVMKSSSVSAIKNLQAALNVALGANLSAPLVVDGVWGAKTTAAVMAFQTWAKLSADGKVGPKTVAALNATLK